MEYFVHQRLRKQPTDSDWGRAVRNAERVKRLDGWVVDDPWGPRGNLIPVEVLLALSSYCKSQGWHAEPSQSLLPNLRALSCRTNVNTDSTDSLGLYFNFVSYLVSDKLKTFSLHVHASWRSSSKVERAILPSLAPLPAAQA